MNLFSPQHEQLQHPTFEQQNHQIQILSDEVIDSAQLKPILHEVFLRAMDGNDNP